MSVTVRNSIAIAILCASLMSAVGFLTGNKALEKFGEAYGVTLLPMSFTERNGYENYSSVVLLVALLEDGRTVTVDGNTFFSQVSGPHRYVSIFVNTFFWGPSFTTNWTHPLFQYAFCRETFLNGEVVSILLKYSSARTGEALTTLPYECT